jgi:hypothetical protein
VLCGVGWSFNYIDVFMHANNNLMQVHRKIVDNHGRVDNVRLFDKDYKVFEDMPKIDKKTEVEETKQSESKLFVEFKNPETTLF